MTLILSPHSDDIELFCAFTAMREHPYAIIITESWIQFQRGSGVTQEMRWAETLAAAEVLGYPVFNLGVRDDNVNDEKIEKALKRWVPVFDKVYAPMLQGGNEVHDMTNRVALKLWGDKVIQYSTYTPTCLYTVGNKEIIPTKEEVELKNKALMCHQTQFDINRVHFDAVFGRSEWLL